MIGYLKMLANWSKIIKHFTNVGMFLKGIKLKTKGKVKT